MGTPEFAVPALQSLIDAGHEICCVYTQPPRAGGRGQKARTCPVHDFATKKGLEARTPRSLKQSTDQEAFVDLGADAAVVAAYGLILPKPILEGTRLGCFNIHASLLPRWRGAAPIQRAIMAGDSESGVCIMQMEEGLDTGPVFLREQVAIDPGMTAGDLHDRLAELGGPLIVRALDSVAAGTATPTPQPDEGVTYATKIDKAEARLDWRRPALELARLVRGLAPFPGAWFELDGERIKVLGAETAEQSGTPGRTLDAHLTVACGEGALRLTRLQRGGRKPMAAADFLRGHPVPTGAELH
jgi:methionyl-tRNA formyltransferase